MTGRSGLVVAALLALLPSAANAAVEISSKATQNMTCTGGVCTPTAKKSVLNIGDLANLLASGNTTVKSTSQNPDIEFDASLSWQSAQRLTLDSYHDITFGDAVNVVGAGALTITTSDGGSGGDFEFTGKGHVGFQNLTSSLVINGHSYVLVKNLKTLAADLHRPASNYYAIANKINVAGRHYARAPLGQGFEGLVLEGLGNTISNLTIMDQRANDEVGLFSGAGTDDMIRDLGLVSVNINGSGSYVGSIAGELEASSVIKNCYATGQVSGTNGSAYVGGLVGQSVFGTIINSHSAVDVSGGDGSLAIGGLIGYFFGLHANSITQSYASGTVSAGDGAAVGGLIGHNEGCGGGSVCGIDQDFATGAVTGGDSASVGGLIGENSGATVTNSYAMGSATGGNGALVGGLIGSDPDNSDEHATPVVKFSYSIGAETGGSGAVIGGLIGQDAADSTIVSTYWDLDTGVNDPSKGAGNVANDPGITGLTDTQVKSGLPAGFDKAIWKETAKINFGYPYLIGDQPPK
jgi:hypothetical protein